MSNACKEKVVVRKSFGKINDIVPLPNLIEVQSNSFNEFVQLDFLPEERKLVGLEKVFKDIFPIDYTNKMSLEYLGYELGTWECTCGKVEGIEQRYAWSCSSCKSHGTSRLKHKTVCPNCDKDAASYHRCSECLSRVHIKLPLDAQECRSTSQTFSLPLKVKMQLIVWDIEQEEKEEKRKIRDVKEQEIFFLDLPVMADLYDDGERYRLGSNATFIINGIDRVIVSQIHRSPGVIFASNKKHKDGFGSGYIARIIPMRGSWIDFENDNKDILYVRIDKNKKILATTFLQALGYTRNEITNLFYSFDSILVKDGKFHQELDASCLGMRIEKGMLPKELEAKYVNKKVTEDIIKRLAKEGTASLFLKKSQLVNRTLAKDVVDSDSGEVLAVQGEVFSEELYDRFRHIPGLLFSVVSSADYVLNPIVSLTLGLDTCKTQEEAVKEVYSKLFPGDIAPYQEMLDRIENLFFNPRFYDLTQVGRVKVNRKLNIDVPLDVHHLTKEDIVSTMRYFINLRERGEGSVDDIDHLGNRRIRLVGELLTNQMYSGMLRIERIVRERYRMYDSNKSMAPYDLMNVKPLVGIVKEFFATGQLSQFMDQTNPLAEITHKRRLSSLGPGGIVKDRATYEVRDVHTSHYGRICPVETPEGQAIGLISSLATLASVNNLGFIESPYRKVVDGEITNEVVYLDAFEENKYFIAQAELLKKDTNILPHNRVLARHQGNFMYTDSNVIGYIDLSPKQLVSVATSLIPFLEHDDAVRALMGSNMQRQAVPLVKAENALVGTGMEGSLAEASGACLVSKYNGIVEYVSADKIIIRADENQFVNSDDWIANSVQVYHLRTFQGSSYETCIHQSPIVSVGQRVSRNQFLTNASAIVDHELALGTNLTVAFMPWRGYNYEDAIVVSRRLVSDDSFSSIHITEYVADARETRLGPEEITSDIPNVSSSALESLDSDGIVKIGTRVKPGDILVGKVTLKGDIQHSPEEKLLRAIFGEKSREVKDSSLRVSAGVEGVVVGVKVLSRSGARKDDRYKEVVAKETVRLKDEFEKQKHILSKMISEKIVLLLDEKDILSKKQLIGKTLEDLFKLSIKDKNIAKQITSFKYAFETQLHVLESLHKQKIADLKRGDQLPSGVIKMVKVYLATLRPIQVGDKIAGRHGNKGVVSLVLPPEDMPFFEDGTPVDVVLNPLGVPSRMNVGQVLETILGLAGKKVGKNFAQMLEKQSYQHIKNEVEKVFDKDFANQYEEKYGKEGLTNLARCIAQKGMHYKTPVFDGASFENDIQPILKDLNLSNSGSYKLRDGRTGEYFDQKITVGVMYMIKLNHMVDDKLHARSVGPYSLITQQPLGGKAQRGGQRFGEMEVWALEAYGAAYTLQEFLTYKSDDVIGRHLVYNALVRGAEVPEPGLPESFNVLIKELQGLALRVDLFKTGKEDIQ